jgi:hypothetical protein
MYKSGKWASDVRPRSVLLGHQVLIDSRTIEMHDLLLGPGRLMRVVVRDAVELVLIRKTSQDEAVEVAFGIDQSRKRGLVLGFWYGGFVEVDVGVEEP